MVMLEDFDRFNLRQLSTAEFFELEKMIAELLQERNQLAERVELLRVQLMGR